MTKYQSFKKNMLEQSLREMKRLNDPLENWVYRIINEV